MQNLPIEKRERQCLNNGDISDHDFRKMIGAQNRLGVLFVGETDVSEP
jgi:hypothetical protein